MQIVVTASNDFRQLEKKKAESLPEHKCWKSTNQVCMLQNSSFIALQKCCEGINCIMVKGSHFINHIIRQFRQEALA